MKTTKGRFPPPSGTLGGKCRVKRQRARAPARQRFRIVLLCASAPLRVHRGRGLVLRPASAPPYVAEHLPAEPCALTTPSPCRRHPATFAPLALAGEEFRPRPALMSHSSDRRCLRASTPLGTVLHVFPDRRPLLAPRKRPLADGAELGGQMRLAVGHCSSWRGVGTGLTKADQVSSPSPNRRATIRLATARRPDLRA